MLSVSRSFALSQGQRGQGQRSQGRRGQGQRGQGQRGQGQRGQGQRGQGLLERSIEYEGGLADGRSVGYRFVFELWWTRG
ncbi:MAG: hypothetical protein EHM43_08420 [Ignavibacteriae bacterium]|nr:MAG: hypothetical protein EHM43_08420 [Ignavibacteriota bacterium]